MLNRIHVRPDYKDALDCIPTTLTLTFMFYMASVESDVGIADTLFVHAVVFTYFPFIYVM